MLIKFEVIRSNNRILQIKTDDSQFPEVGSIPVFTKDKLQISKYHMPLDISLYHYQSLINQKNKTT